MRNAVIVLSLEFPEALKRIKPLVLVSSLTEMRIFPAGEAMNPDKEMIRLAFAVFEFTRALAMTVVPSHSFTEKFAAPAVSETVTVPEPNHVPLVPCAADGPVK